MRPIGFAGALLLALGTSPLAYTAAPAVETGRYQIAGFRSAKFGMTPDAVRAAVRSDFGTDVRVGPVANSTALRVVLVRLDPAPGMASITYLFDASARLTAINIGWSTGPSPTADERQAMENGAERLQRYFKAQPVQPPIVSYGGVLPTGGLLLHRAEDAAGATVELTGIGLPYARASGQSAVEPQGAAALRLGYFAPPAS